MGKRRQEMFELADYVLSGGHEEERIKRELDEDHKGESRTHKRTIAEQSIWYIAFKVRYGRSEARKRLTELLGEL